MGNPFLLRSNVAEGVWAFYHFSWSEQMRRWTISLINRREPLWAWLVAMVFTATVAAQTGKAPTVVMAPVSPVAAPRTARTVVNLNFRVPHGFHINSNTPKSEFLIPTTLKMTNLGKREIGWPFNLEADIISKQIVQFLERRAAPSPRYSGERAGERG